MICPVCLKPVAANEAVAYGRHEDCLCDHPGYAAMERIADDHMRLQRPVRGRRLADPKKFAEEIESDPPDDDDDDL